MGRFRGWRLDGALAIEVLQRATAEGLHQLRRSRSRLPGTSSCSVAIIVFAYLHRILIPPELMLVGDLLAYIDIFSVIFLIGLWSRLTTLLFAFKQGAAGVLRLARGMLARAQRLDVRHRREGGTMAQKRPATRGRDEDGEPAAVYGVAWA